MKSASDNDTSLSPPIERTEKTKGRCDVCGKKDDFQGFKLRKCTMCGVCVHETCYSLVPTAHGRPDPDWQCHACTAVGKDVVVSKPGQEIKTHRQDERPTDCALCPIVGGEHAMHPLYDTHGSSGTQVVLRQERKGRRLPERLAWVHTLCAMGTGMNRSTKGCVFGCDADGDYDDNDDEGFDAKEPARKKSRPKDRGEKNGQQNNESDLDSNKDEEGSDSKQVTRVHHFVICGMDGENTKWSRTIADVRALKCYICGNQDCSPLHIPIQCTKNDDGEREEYRIRHEDEEPCFQPVHVGCAWWGDGNKLRRRVFFWPGLPIGTSGKNSEPELEVYCCAHAKTVWQNNPKRQRDFAPRSHNFHRPRRSVAADASAASPPRRTGPTQERLNGSGRTSEASAAAFSRPISNAATKERAGRHENGEVRKGNGKDMHEKSSNLWSTLWMPGQTGGSFDFGSWNTCHEYDATLSNME